MPLPVALRAFRSRNYRLFVGGQLVSLIGTWMQSVAQSWLIYRLTGSAALLGLIGFAGQIPIFVLAPFGGVIADRRNRHRILITTQTVMMVLAFALAALTLEGSVRVWHIFVLASLLGIANAFDIPARQAFLLRRGPRPYGRPLLAPRCQLRRRRSWRADRHRSRRRPENRWRAPGQYAR